MLTSIPQYLRASAASLKTILTLAPVDQVGIPLTAKCWGWRCVPLPLLSSQIFKALLLWHIYDCDSPRYGESVSGSFLLCPQSLFLQNTNNSWTLSKPWKFSKKKRKRHIQESATSAQRKQRQIHTDSAMSVLPLSSVDFSVPKHYVALAVLEPELTM